MLNLRWLFMKTVVAVAVSDASKTLENSTSFLPDKVKRGGSCENQCRTISLHNSTSGSRCCNASTAGPPQPRAHTLWCVFHTTRTFCSHFLCSASRRVVKVGASDWPHNLANLATRKPGGCLNRTWRWRDRGGGRGRGRSVLSEDKRPHSVVLPACLRQCHLPSFTTTPLFDHALVRRESHPSLQLCGCMRVKVAVQKPQLGATYRNILFANQYIR